MAMCEFTSAASRLPVGELSSFGFFRLLRGHSRRLLITMLLPTEMCLIVLMAMEADYMEYEQTLNLKPAFLLLYCISIVHFSFDCLCATTL
jgi:hypothetical protein